MSKSKNSVASEVRSFLERPINDLGYEIWDVEYVKEGAEWHLIITIDSEAGISIDDCEKVHRLIDPILDEHDPIPEAYNLDVSSPGIERALRTKEHYDKCVGEKIALKLFKPLDGSKQYVGELIGYTDGDTVKLGTASGEIEIPFEAIAKANVVFEF